MAAYLMTETENLLAELIWEKEPIRSGELVKLAAQRFGWKKSTTYTVLRKLCKNAIVQNQAAVVTAKVSRAEYTGRKREQNLQDTVPASLKSEKPGETDIEELVKLVEGEEGCGAEGKRKRIELSGTFNPF